MKNSYRFFENKECQYFPCHKGLTHFNCLFCYCPMYQKQDCPGNPRYLEKDGEQIKDCSDCVFPHQPQNYDKMIALLKNGN